MDAYDIDNWSNFSTDARAMPSSGMSFGQASTYTGLFGAVQSGFGAYFNAQSQASSLRFQASLAKINARMAEGTAESILQAGAYEAGRLSQKYGQVAGAQKAGFGARGIQGGVGSAAEQSASTELAKQTDMFAIDSNAVRQAWATRTQGVSYANEARIKSATAEGISPFVAGETSLLNSAGSVAESWYRMKMQSMLAQQMGIN